MEKKRIIAVIPAYNEEKYIEEVIRKIKKYPILVIVVDDCSKDKTYELAEKAGAIVLKHPINLGLGASLKTGCEAAIQLNADYIITIDGDGQHDADEIPKLFKKLIQTNSDIIFGEREFNKDMPLNKRIINKTGHIISKLFYNTNIKDTQTGFRIFTREAYEKIKWESHDYAVASEILMRTQKNKLKYTSEAIKTIYHENYKGTTLLDGIKITNKMAKLKFNI